LTFFNKFDNFANNIKEGGIIIKRLLICLVSIVLFVALTFNIKSVYATDPNLNNNNGTTNNGTTNNGTTNNGTTNNGTTNNGTTNNGTNGTDTDLNGDDDLNDTTDTDNDATDNNNNDTVDDDTDNNNLITNLLYGAGGIVLGSALTYFLSRNRDTI
jgi:hypothetical protein